MFLVKCSCDCWFTLKDNGLATNTDSLTCQNCGKKFNPSKFNLLSKSTTDNGFALYRLPDDTELIFKAKF